MAWVTKIERKEGVGRIPPSKVVAYVKLFEPSRGGPIFQIDTLGSSQREIPDKVSQTLQFDRDAAKHLFDLLKRTYDF